MDDVSAHQIYRALQVKHFLFSNQIFLCCRDLLETREQSDPQVVPVPRDLEVLQDKLGFQDQEDPRERMDHMEILVTQENK